MLCNSDRLVMEVKQGEARSFGFTIEHNELVDGTKEYAPMDLTEYSVTFQVKKSPYFKVEPLIEKIITTEYSEANGHIYDPTLGKFKVSFTEADTTKLPPDTYYVIIYLINGTTKIIISGEGDKSGILRFCKQ